MISRSSNHLPLYIFVALATVLRLFTIPSFGFGVDEAHYLLYALNLDFSYFDHPPLVGWVHYVFTSIFGLDETGARVSAVLIGAASSILLYHWLVNIFNSTKIAFVGAVALNASFIFNALFMMLMPDTLLFLLIIPILHFALKIEVENRLRDWIVLGALLGVAGLSKYTAFLFVVSLIIYFVYRRRFDLLYGKNIIISIAVSAILIAPILFWNMEHDWISFAFQSSHVGGADNFSFGSFFESLAVQLGAYSPFLAPLAYYGLYKSLISPQNRPLFISGIFGSVLVLFFVYNSFYAVALPHWSALFYFLFIPIGIAFMFQSTSIYKRRYVVGAVSISLAISLLLHAELRFKFFPLPDYQSVHRDIYGWKHIGEEAASLIVDKQQEAIAVSNWSLASRAIYYTLPYGVQTYLIDDRYDQFDIWQKDSPLGKDLLFINTHDFTMDLDSIVCKSSYVAKRFDLTLDSSVVNSIELVWCIGFGGKV